MKLLYPSDYDSQTDKPAMLYEEQRKKYHNGQKDGIYNGIYFEAKT